MATIFGIQDKSGKPIEKLLLDKVFAHLNFSESEHSNFWIKDNIAFGSSLFFTTPQSCKEELPYWDKKTGHLITADARIDYRNELLENLKLDRKEALNLPDSILILKAFQKWGKECAKNLYGDFSFAIWDTNKNDLYCFRDQIGIRPLFYINTNEIFAFSSNIRGLFPFFENRLTLDEKCLVEKIVLCSSDTSQSPYSGIWRLKPASYLKLNSNGQLTIRKYWDLKKNTDISLLDERQLVEGLKSRLQSAVEERVRSCFSIGTELSGGLDSSSIASIASSKLRQNGQSIFAFTQSLNQSQRQNYFPFCDETAYSKEMSKFAMIKDHIFITGEDKGIYESIERTLIRLSGPFSQDYALLSDLLYEEAEKKNIRVLLSGFGGDEGVTSYGSIGHRYGIERWRTGKHIWRVMVKLKKSWIGKSALNLIFRLNEVLKKILFSIGIRTRRYRYIPLQRSLEKKYQAKNVFLNSRILRKQQTLDSKMYERILGESISNRIESSCINASYYNIEYRYPLLDVKLLEYYYSVPYDLKFRDGIGRYIFRMATKGILPESIRWRSDKSGYTVPNVHYRIKIDESKFRKLISESIDRNSYHYIDYHKLNRMFNKMLNREQNAKIGFGNMIFLNSIGVLILQKWQREGKINIGIRC